MEVFLGDAHTDPPQTRSCSPWVVGQQVALEMLLTGDRFDTDYAFRTGLVNKVVPKERLMDEAEALARRLCQNGPLGERPPCRVSRECDELTTDRSEGGDEEQKGRVRATRRQ